MRTILILVSLFPAVACHGGGSPTSGDAPTGADASVGIDAGGDPDTPPPPPVAACGLLGLPSPPTTAVAAGVVRLRDVDGDGRLDLLVVNETSVSVSLGNGDTSFRAAVESPRGDPTILGLDAVALADLDGDHKLDLVVVNPHVMNGSSLDVLRGDGTGRFAPRGSFAIDAASAIAVADLDGDGKLDLVLVGSTARVRLGHGDGTFGDETAYPVRGVPTSVAVADLDGDHIVDLIVASSQAATLSVLPGVGNGTFGAAVEHDTVSAPGEITPVDLNGDGKIDLVIGGRSGSVSVVMNEGSAGLAAHVDYLLDTPHVLAAFAVGDVDRDGKLDVVALDTARVHVLAGNGDGTLRPAVTARTVTGSEGVALGDVSGDGALDVVITDGTSTVSVLQSDASGRLISATPYAMERSSSRVTTADLDRDGHVDLILTLPAADGSTVGIALGQPDGRFRDLVEYPLSGLVKVQDVSGDGIADLVASSPHMLSILRGRGDGTFGDRVDLAAQAAGVFAIGDLDGDGKPDLLVADSEVVDTIRHPVLVLYLGHGDGTFRAAGTRWQLDPQSGVDSLALGDVNRDGKLDVAVGYLTVCAECLQGSSGLELLLNSGDGTLHSSAASASFQGGVALADLDGDGILDVVTHTFVQRGVGDGTLRPAVSYGPRLNGELQVADLTGDGKLDIAASRTSEGALSAWPGNGDGTVQPALTYANLGRGFAVADFNKDGRLDVVAAGSSTETFDVSVARCVR